ncbi:MAG TPA: TonB family protein [candidate division WOR-3 bacterium]|uniref:TonB family protein n=1 Tax=candidate division WOR-3 bacterium TaxID=2052148 RepID=A0A9C9JZ42_UNCW3|nr:TonB family protein [candidate division WOR-3 bacterium]
MKKFFSVLPILLLLTAVCAKKEEKLVGEQGGKMVIGTTELLTTISPLSPSVFGSNEILDLLFMHLHRIDPETGKMKPELASSWEFSEDLTSITYYLRDDVTWWDGEPVTAEDVLYTYEKMKDPKTNYPNIARLRFIKNVEVVGPHAIKFTFDKVYADLLTDSDIMPVPKHVYEKKGDKFGQAPVGNGPYKIKEWIPGSGLVLYANDSYYRGKPPLDTIFIEYYSDVTKMYEDFKNGNLDMVLNLTPEAAKELEKNKNIKVDSRPGNTFTYVGWNLKHPYLKDKEIRKALTMAINTKKILNDVFSGMGTISLGPLPPSSWGYNEEITPIQYNLIGAKKILEKKGFTDWNRNKIYDKNRKDFTLTIITNVESPERVKILESVANDLKALGVRVKAKALDTKSFITALVQRDFDGFIMGWSMGEKIDPTVYWHSDPKKGRFNFVSYKNSVVDSLIEIGVAMLNRKKAKEIWHEFQKIVYGEMPYTFLVVANKISATYKRVRGVEQGISIADAYTYWIPEAERRVVVASLAPAPVDTTPEVTTPTATEEKPTRPTSKKVEELTPTKPPEVVKPEALLEAAVKKETTSVAPTPPDTGEAPAITPPEPPKPSIITRATPIKQVMPKYPDAARAVGATGRVVVRVVVGTDGKVKSATILSSFGNPACEAEALAAAKKWVFKPATKDGEPFEQKISIPFNFKP